MATSYAVSRILDIYPSLGRTQAESRLTYGSFACVDRRFVYMEVPKVASTTLKKVLRELGSAGPLRLFVPHYRETRRDMFIHAPENLPFPSLLAFDNSAQRYLLESPDVLRFAIVRNPYKRLISAWNDKVVLCEPSVVDVYGAVRGGPPPLGQKTPLTFAEFVSYLEATPLERWDGHWRRQVDLIFPKALAFNHIGNASELDRTLLRLRDHFGLSQSLTPSRSNEALLIPVPKLTESLAARVYALYAEDFSTFGYNRDSWPRYEEQPPSAISDERLIEEITERNVIISHLYNELSRCQEGYWRVSRFSLENVQKKLRRFFRLKGA